MQKAIKYLNMEYARNRKSSMMEQYVNMLFWIYDSHSE